jgi:hypothetical protein
MCIIKGGSDKALMIMVLLLIRVQYKSFFATKIGQSWLYHELPYLILSLGLFTDTLN